jgi:hypothetical protein
VDAEATRCPKCGQPRSRGGRRLNLLIGAGGLGALLFLVLLMWLVVRDEDARKAPVPVDERAQQEVLPEPSKQPEKDAKPEKPEKPPPLNQ